MICRSFILLSLFFALECFGQDSDKDRILRQDVLRKGQADVSLPYSQKLIGLLSPKVSIGSVKNSAILVKLSPLTVDWFIDQHLDYTINAEPDPRKIRSASDISEAKAWDSYPSYSQYTSIIQGFRDTYPTLCRIDTIGLSLNGRLILAVKISDNAATDEAEPEVFYTSTMHGDETAGFVLMLRLTEYLLMNYNTDNEVKNLVDNLEIWINPLANPDGTYKVGNVVSDQSVRFNAHGVDLNRNFPDPVDEDAVKEKETLDMMKFLRKHRFTLSANFHSGDEVVNYPWDRWISKLHADNNWFHDISRAYADTVHKFSEAGYMSGFDDGIVRGAVWYVIYGGRQDYVTWELQGREVTIELDDAFVTPASRLSLLWTYNNRSMLDYLSNALYGIHGKVVDRLTGEPVPARIFIAGHDKDSSQVYADSLTGTFTRLLEPGTWDLTVSARGYIDTIVTNVTILQYEKVDLMIDLEPLTSLIDTPMVGKAIMYPNPAGGVIRAVMGESMAGSIQVKIYNSTGQLISDYEATFIPGTPLEIDLSHIPPGIYSVLFRKGKNNSLGKFMVIR